MTKEPMPNAEDHIKRIQEKLQQLVKHHNQLQKENAHLRQELEKNDLDASQHRQMVETLRQQVDVLKISSGSWEEADKKEFEKRISQYIKDIDKCIALLSQ
jgi:archaellum component FlaC